MTDESQALVPIEQKDVEFYGDQVTAVRVEVDGQEQVYVPLRPIVEYLGLAWSSQLQRVKRDPVMSRALRGVLVTNTPGAGGGTQETTALPLRLLPGFLFGVNAQRVREDLRDKVIRYQERCFEVLWNAFQTEALARRAPAGSDTAILVQVRETALAVAALADQQLAMQAQQAEMSSRLDRAAEVVKSLAGRVGTIERKLAAGPITEELAAEIAARVKALAEYLTSKQPGQVHYQAIYSELYRRFGVSGYKSIRIDQYADVLAFLEDWRRAAG